MLENDLIEMLTCPGCKNHVVLSDSRDSLICHDCNLSFEIKNDIPIMLLDKAEALSSSTQTIPAD